MLRALYRRLREWTRRDEEPRFRGSLLDRSIHYAHGGGGEEVERELERTSEEAQKLAEAQRDH